MSNSYKFYSDTKDVMKKYVNATEGAIIYGISKSRIMVLASEAGAVYKVGNSALINTERFEQYLEKFKEPTRPLPKHIWNKLEADLDKNGKPKWEDTITNWMLYWSYTPEQKEVKKALAAGVPKATILTYFYPEVTVEKMSTYRKKQ